MIKKIHELTNEEINNYIEKLLPIKKIEKDKYGEVFTDPKLINKILDLFPISVFKNPNFKWLDPSVGAAFFMILLYQRLMKNLETWEPNKKKRSNHIINKMLFMVEINKSNCQICKDLLGENINLICGDFLADFQFPNYHNISFDCIIGNPPFQQDYGLSESGKRILGGKNKLYERIFIKSYEMLREGGFLSFIVPNNIFSGNGSDSYKILLKNKISFVSFNPSNQTFFPGIQQSICYFLLKKEEPANQLTLIESNDSNKFQVTLLDRPVNPVHDWTMKTEKLINKYVGNDRNSVKYNRGKMLKSYKGNKFPIIYSSSKTIYTNKKDLATGIGLKKAIIFAISNNFSFKMDYTGKFGSGPNTFYIPFETAKQGNSLEKFLKSDDYKMLVSSTKTNRKYLKIALIEYLKLGKIFNMNNKTKKKRTHQQNISRKRI